MYIYIYIYVYIYIYYFFSHFLTYLYMYTCSSDVAIFIVWSHSPVSFKLVYQLSAEPSVMPSVTCILQSLSLIQQRRAIAACQAPTADALRKALRKASRKALQKIYFLFFKQKYKNTQITKFTTNPKIQNMNYAFYTYYKIRFRFSLFLITNIQKMTYGTYT